MSATYLSVRYEEREQAKALGARWDRTTKAWFVPDGKSIEPFRQWISAPVPTQDPRDEFASEMRKAGFRLDGQHPIMDGKIHRVPVEGDKGTEKNGSYRGFGDGVPNGWHQNFKSADKPIPWKATGRLTQADRAAIASAAPAALHQSSQQRSADAARAAQTATEILKAAAPAVGHLYLTTKQVQAHGLFIAAAGTLIETESGKQIDVSGKLLVPIRDCSGAIISFQMINDAGRKMFLRGGKTAGGRHVIGKMDSPWPLFIAEGYVTGATIHEATGLTVAVAFTAHNLGVVAAQCRAAYPERTIFVAGDNDHHLPMQLDPQGRPKLNVGTEAAKAAAAAIDGHALIPDPAPGRADDGTDWNDAMKNRGMAAIQRELAAGQAAGSRLKIANDIAYGREYGRAPQPTRERQSLSR